MPSCRASLALLRCALLAWAVSPIAGCDAEDIEPRRFDGGAHGGAGNDPDAGPGDDGGPGSDLLTAPEAEEVGTLELGQPVTDVIHAEDLSIGLHEAGGASILELADPTSPELLAALPSDGRVVGVAIDPQRHLLFVLTVRGDLRAFRVSDPRNPIQLAQLALSEPGGEDSLQGLVRVGSRLFALGGSKLLPVRVQVGAAGGVSLLAEDPVALDADPQLVAAGAGVVYVVFAGGKVQLWSATDSLEMLDQGHLGADVVGLVARGRRLFVALQDVGLRVVDMSRKGTLRVLFDAPEFDDLTGLERFGNLLVVSLARGLVIALDLSDVAAPRALVSRRGELPEWIAAIGGNLVLGGGTQLTVLGVPPFVAASLPAPIAGSLPRYGRIPLQLSKSIGASSVTLESVTLRCDGAAITGTLSVSPDGSRITFLPADTLPAGASCELTLDGVLDALGLPLTMPRGGVSFTTATAAPAPIDGPASDHPHTADGVFTDWAPGKTEGFEYFDVTPAQGMYGRFYADFDGQKLWLLNDWLYDRDDVDPDCYSQFGVFTGDGSQRWEIRAYGDQRIEVRLDGTLLDADDERVTGGYAFSATPDDPEKHTVYELAITTEPGSWGAQLHAPGPSFSCHRLETDPISFAGSSTQEGSTIDPTQVPAMPEQPEPSLSDLSSDDPTLSWDPGEGADAFTTFVVELSAGDELDDVFFRAVVYGGTLAFPPGLLQPGAQYTLRLTAYNLAGSVSSEPLTFSVPGGDPGAPTIESIQPSSVTQGDAVSITIRGEGFVEGARAYIDGEALSTTFEDDTTLVIVLTADDTADAGTFELTVRNVPGDQGSESDALELTVTAPQSAPVTLQSLTPAELTEDVAATVTVTMADAPDGTYTLVLTPDGGGSELSFDCVYGDADECQAEVTLSTAGVYDAKIRVGTGGDAYDTDPLDQALTANAPCVHDECWPGASLSAACSACAAAVCASADGCCSTAWSSACITAADAAGSCTCTPPSLAVQQTLSPATQATDDLTPVLVTMQDEPTLAGYTFTLILTPDGMIDGTPFACAGYSSTEHTCTAQVTGLAEGSYDAAVQVTHTASAQSYLSASIDSAFTVTAL